MLIIINYDINLIDYLANSRTWRF